jgi:ankyrin repeat protein
MQNDIWKLLNEQAWDDVRQSITDSPNLASETSSSGMTIPTFLAFNGQMDIAQFVADHKISLNQYESAILGRWNSLKDAVSADASSVSSFSPEGFTPLHLAAAFRQFECVILLIRSGADLKILGKSHFAKNTPLGAAAFGGEATIVQALLAAGADPNIPDDGGFTPLHIAAQDGNATVVELLLRFGASKGALAAGATPASLAEAAGHAALAGELVA